MTQHRLLLVANNSVPPKLQPAKLRVKPSSLHTNLRYAPSQSKHNKL